MLTVTYVSRGCNDFANLILDAEQQRRLRDLSVFSCLAATQHVVVPPAYYLLKSEIYLYMHM